ncbi:P protein-like isoform X2 [Mercenaria mercenaria]|uniref:P protein-like isoform X2 n=1 Tax=Mercenaria mercenaria TaxID=6596 RepID=UPI00234F785D|nr:P protein-like isoform X2 [Mercenaria mercenaria]
MNRRRESTPETQIHINPNRPKTPVSRPQNLNKGQRSVSPSDGIVYETHTDGNQSETMIFSRENTPQPISYGTMPTTVTPVSEISPLLNESCHTPLTDSQSEEDENAPFFSKENLVKNKWTLLKQLKVFILTVGALVCIVFIMINAEHEEHVNQTSVRQDSPSTISLHDVPGGIKGEKVVLTLQGPFEEITNTSSSNLLEVRIGNSSVVNLNVIMDDLRTHSINTVLKDLDLSAFGNVHSLDITLKYTPSDSVVGTALADLCVPMEYSYTFTADTKREEVCALIVLILVYGLIIFDLVHRTVAAILGSLATVAVMSAFGLRPSLEKIMTWLDVETLSLLFGMMIIVAIFSETGFFDYCALMAYKLAKGQVWPLITLLCAFSAVVSAFLDNVTTILLLTPVTIRLCEVLNLDPKKILIAEVLFSNIGGTATGIGDPPNVIIISHKDVKANDIGFSNFTGHMIVGIIFVSLAGYGLLRLFYRNMEDLENKDPVEITELRHEIDMWRRAAKRIVAISREEKIMQAIFLQRVAELENKLVKQIYKMKRRKQKNFKEMLSELEKKHKITDKALLVKSGIVLAAVILLFFLHSFITGMHLGLGWIAIMGAILLMVLADMQDLETIIHMVEWSTLIFFAALFSLMEGLKELGLISWIGGGVKSILTDVNQDQQVLVAIILILWVSAIASSFIDNIPFTTAMIPILITVHEDVGIPLLPMILALAFGACLGGNGTLIGASANVVSAGIAEQHGYGFSFLDFFRVGFPMMLVTTLVSMVYLLICHAWGSWGNGTGPAHS